MLDLKCHRSDRLREQAGMANLEIAIFAALITAAIVLAFDHHANKPRVTPVENPPANIVDTQPD